MITIYTGKKRVKAFPIVTAIVDDFGNLLDAENEDGSVGNEHIDQALNFAFGIFSAPYVCFDCEWDQHI